MSPSDQDTTEKPKTTEKLARTAKLALGAVAAGAAGAYFFDPRDGARRRHVARDRVFAAARRPARKAAAEANRKASYAEGVVRGAVHEASTPGQERDPRRLNDPALARKIESEVLGATDAPKESTSVNVEDGVVYLRGELGSPEEIRRLIGATKKVPGVSDVRSLLHLPGQNPPSKESARSA